ncbi:unnamed protein product [Peronospora farinosa]|uniref:Uncharacterized protein n=1 Tax=Peronospora farinosa TaxID=134698 RepID=A0AAV0T747_9STRA|nr:unnamed protein product [Peronospora farinosa]CAI5715791.1 unnamed protein product [Peronospora farinosa]
MGPWLKRNGPRSGMMLDTTSFMIDCLRAIFAALAKRHMLHSPVSARFQYRGAVFGFAGSDFGRVDKGLRNSPSLGGLNIHGEIVHETQERGENVSIRSSRGYDSVANLAVREEKDPSANDTKAQLYRLIMLFKISAMSTTLFGKTAA